VTRRAALRGGGRVVPACAGPQGRSHRRPMIRPEDRAAIETHTDALVEAAPELTPDRLARLRRLVSPPRTPRPRREPRADEPPAPLDG